jgi:acylpyruvate hydrolase
MIGKKGKNISSSEALDYVGGYFLALDMTDRELQNNLKK